MARRHEPEAIRLRSGLRRAETLARRVHALRSPRAPGAIDAGLNFIARSIEWLRPGGLAAHATEFNLNSDEGTSSVARTVVYRTATSNDWKVRSPAPAILPIL